MQRSRRRFLMYATAGLATGFGGFAYWLSASQQRAARWGRRLLADAHRPIIPAPLTPDPARWSNNQITIAWLGHATTLINFYGIRILTDPALGNRVGVSLGVGTIGPKRQIAPALIPGQLPDVDVILLSHAHMDHMDLPTLQRLNPGTFTVTAKETADLVTGNLSRTTTELAWNDTVTFRNKTGDLQIEAIEVKHWGRRWPSEKTRGYNGYVLRREGKALVFAGDTASTPLFTNLRSRGPLAAAIMPIGAYRPWIWNHCTPEQAVGMANAARAPYIVPVHHQTFRLSEEPMEEPIQRLESALAKEPQRLALRRIGATFVVPAA